MNLIERVLEVIKEAPLTPMQRRKKAIIMKRLAPKIARKRKIAMRKKAGVDFGASMVRFRGGQWRVNIDKKVEKKKTLMQKLAKRMIPVMRRKEIERLKQLRKSKTDK